jgi:hypothetical protein
VADQLYTAFRNALLGNSVHSAVDLDTNNTRLILRDEGADALNLADQDLADITTAAREAESANLTSPTVGTAGDGAFDHANETISSVSGTTVESLDYFHETGVDSTSLLFFNIDTWTGLPLTPNGGDVTIQPAAGGVFQINAT